MNNVVRIRPKERDAILQSLRAGVVPRNGQQHIQVGRAAEVKALVSDIERIGDGGSSVRFIIGEYGSGKTFFLHLVRSIALEKRLVAIHADLGPDRRLQGTGGQARSLYTELMRNAATRSKPDGGALASVVERFITSALEKAREHGVSPELVIRERLQTLSELVGGYDFAEVISAYWRGHDTGNETLKSDAVRWLRGEFSTKTDAKAALGVRTIVDDANWYDMLKLLARFVRQAGYAGLFVCLDELVNLYKLANTKSRSANYEQILRLLNDCLQGTAEGLGFVLGGTPEFLLDTRRGLYSYQALQSRLAENMFTKGGLVDFTGPVLRLANLTPEDLYILLGKLRLVYASGDPAQYVLPDDGLAAFMNHCSKRIGDAYFRTPRNTITAFVNLLAVLDQNRGASWTELVGTVDITPDSNPDLAHLPGEERTSSTNEATGPRSEEDDDLAIFKL
ncbi:MULTISPECIES: ATP-binding protein [Sorangium]|uniref:ATP-binding protein n=1 Tax=Sorangium TaxID=39643 RepID=UPI003D9C189A